MTGVEQIRALAAELGFVACGIAALEPSRRGDALDRWLARGYGGTMRYIHRQARKRKDPTLIAPGLRSAVVVLDNYYTPDPPAAPGKRPLRIARYARGRDYHEVTLARLERIAELLRSLGAETARAYVDSGPVPERELAERAGLGWIGKNAMLIRPGTGSFVFIGSVLTDMALPPDDALDLDRCGSCTRCLDACPTGAFVEPRVLDATRCISYLTIEQKGPMPDEILPRLDGWAFGCDICNEVCPWNQRFATPTTVPEFQPQGHLDGADAETFESMEDEAFARRWGDTPLARAGLTGMRRNLRAALASAGLLLSLAFAPHAHAQATGQTPRGAGLPRDLDAWVARTLKEFGQPGLAVAVVKDGRVVLTRGYGLRDLADSAPADAHTIYQIASNTKAFTTALLAMLVDEGKLHWDDHVTDYLPWFQISAPYVTREFTIRDLITHRSGLGLGAGDLLWWHSDYGREEVVRRLRTLQPVTSFRSAYAYDNVLYIAAGLVIESVTRKPWEDVVRERILAPLGMSEVTTTARALDPKADVAAPYGLVDGRLVLVPRDTVDNTAPAGGINANVTDIAKWLIVQLDSGRVGDHRLWTQARAREMWTGVTPLPIGNPPAALPMLAPLRANFSLYALGWFVRDYRGVKLATHTGGLSGMVSRTILVPDARLGIVVLTNGETSAMDAVAFHILDGYLGAPPTDWIAGFHALSQGAEQRADSVMRAQEAGRDRTSKPSLPLARYAGRYTDAMYGDATIAVEGDHLVLRFSHSPAFVGDLEHWQHDTFVARWRSRALADAFVTFDLDPDGSIDAVRLAAVSPLADFSFDYQDLLFRPAAGE